MKARFCDVHNDWTIHLTELLVDVGAYQYQMDPSKTIDSTFKGGKYRLQPASLAADIINMKDRDVPVNPSLCMSPDLDGTNAPSTHASDEHNVFKLPDEKLQKDKFPERFSVEHNKLYFNLESPRVQPMFGEFSNLKPPMFLDYDPNVRNDYKGIVYIGVTHTDTPQDLRFKEARGTRYDSRNDPAWHYEHGIPRFDVLKMVKNGVAAAAVKDIEAFDATDDEGVLITNVYFQMQLDYLNGKKAFEGISARNQSKYIPRRQREITAKTNAAVTSEIQMQRDRSIALGTFNKQLMFQIHLVNRLQQGRIAVMFVNFGSGGISGTLRNEAGLFNVIPDTLFEPNITFFGPIQEYFNLVEAGQRGKKRYIDFLHEDSSLNYLTFKPRHGKEITKRPSDFHKKWPPQEAYSDEALERYRSFSEIVDINSNMANLVVVKNDREIPIMDYIVVMQGSPMMTSHLNHVANLNPHWFKRETFDKVFIPNNL